MNPHQSAKRLLELNALMPATDEISTLAPEIARAYLELRAGALVKWEQDERGDWQLMTQGRTAATVFSNAVWHTWDRDGIGGENSSERTVRKAKIEAAASAIEQGFI